MNNIQKAFKTKARMGLRMATGGVVPNSFSQEAWDNGPAQAPSVGNNMDFTNKMKLQLADLQRENATPGGLGSSRVVNGVAMDGSADAAAAYEKTLQPQAQTSATPGTSPVSSPLATAKAFSGLSMIDQRNLTNPGNQPYGIDGQPVKQGRTFVTPGSAAEASMRDGQISALGNLRKGLRMADGGVVPKETAEQVMARMNAKFGLGGTPAPTPAPAPAPKPAPTPAPSQPTATQGGLLGKTTDMIRSRSEELRKAANYEKGGIVHGPGTRTSDSVPVHLSRGEAVLPGKTVDALGGPDAVEQMIESTNGKPPVRAGLRAGGSYADGTEGRYPYDGKPAPTAQQVYPGFADLWQAVRAKDMPEGGYFANGEKPGPETPAPEWVRKMSPAYARAAQESPEAAQAVLVAGGSPSVQPVKPAQVTTPATVPQSTPAPAPVAAAPAQLANPAADIQSRSTDAEALRGFAQRSMNLPQTGTVVDRGNAGLRAIRDNAGVMNTLNEANSQQGTGISYSKTKGADGKDQLLISGGPATKDQYLGADGKPTNDWTKTAQYQQAIAQNAQDKARLKELQWDNAVTSAGSPSAGYRAEGLRTAQMMLAKDQVDQHGAITPYQQAQLGLQAAQVKATIDNRNADNLRADEAANRTDNETHRKATDDLIKSWSTTDGKLDDQKYAFMQKYAGQFERPKGMSSADHLRNLMDNYAIDTMGDEAGRHWLSEEGTWAGEKTKWKKGAATGNWRRGAPLQDIEYHDPLTGRKIYQSDVNKLSPNQRELFKSRIIQ